MQPPLLSPKTSPSGSTRRKSFTAAALRGRMSLESLTAMNTANSSVLDSNPLCSTLSTPGSMRPRRHVRSQSSQYSSNMYGIGTAANTGNTASISLSNPLLLSGGASHSHGQRRASLAATKSSPVFGLDDEFETIRLERDSVSSRPESSENVSASTENVTTEPPDAWHDQFLAKIGIPRRKSVASGSPIDQTKMATVPTGTLTASASLMSIAVEDRRNAAASVDIIISDSPSGDVSLQNHALKTEQSAQSSRGYHNETTHSGTVSPDTSSNTLSPTTSARFRAGATPNPDDQGQNYQSTFAKKWANFTSSLTRRAPQSPTASEDAAEQGYTVLSNSAGSIGSEVTTSGSVLDDEHIYATRSPQEKKRAQSPLSLSRDSALEQHDDESHAVSEISSLAHFDDFGYERLSTAQTVMADRSSSVDGTFILGESSHLNELVPTDPDPDDNEELSTASTVPHDDIAALTNKSRTELESMSVSDLKTLLVQLLTAVDRANEVLIQSLEVRDNL